MNTPLHQKSLSWYRQAARLVPQDLVLKSIGIPVFIAVFFAAYFYVLKNPAYPVTVMPLTWLDRWISFQPMALPLYVSLWVYVSLPPALLANRRELYIYALAMAGTCLTGLIIFYFWPTTVPVPNIDWALYPGMDFLKNMDASGNACPSLHVATAAFSGFWMHQLLRRFGAPLWVCLFNLLWCIGIVYSTVATRQHVAVDMWAGSALGAFAAWWSWRHLQGAETRQDRFSTAL
ncbi:MAG: phosphatase PAP2 family protein [Polaromonas sp.]|uniref:phosphatase PAP2 family protein n=1 Tax=Polaromonas sp. TaxID=1869339 RepID=UPI0017E2BED4|nr:phosphatase PAP2 family protein [Polaromonas sp.]MBA3594949.1 phosphatase PAP2 family protein [Polaromonas sp.]